MKKLLIERFQELAGIKPLYELEKEDIFLDDEAYDELNDLISKYVKDPDDVEDELDRFDEAGFDGMSTKLKSSLLGDPEYKTFIKNLETPGEPEDLTFEPEDDDYVDEFELKDLTFNQILSSFPNNYQDVHFTRTQPDGKEGNYYRDGINFPNMDDSLTHIGDENAWEDWKNKILRNYGNVEIVLNSEGKNWFDKVFISDDKFNDDKDTFIMKKMSAMQRN